MAEEDNYEGPERRFLPTWQEEIERLEKLFAYHYKVDEEMHTRTEVLLEEIRAELATVKDVVTTWNSLKGTAMVLAAVGKGVKWLMLVGGAIAGVFYIIKGGGPR